MSIKIEHILNAAEKLKGIAYPTELSVFPSLNEQFGCQLYLKREDLQVVRSYKVRGAYNLISSLSEEEKERGVICASAGNHAQGVAYSCAKLGVKGRIYMPNTTPRQKVRQVEFFGKGMIEIVLEGDTFDDAYEQAREYGQQNQMVFVHPFDDPKIMEGQGTVAKEIFDQLNGEGIDYLILPIGGGGLLAGMASYVKALSPHTKIIGVEPQGAPSMKLAIEKGEVVTLESIDPFVDGAAVKRVGEKTFQVAQDLLDDIVLVPEGKVCTTILDLYSQQGIVVEPAGALSIAALHFLEKEIAGKKVVCVISGSNNDIGRLQEIKERSLLYEGLKYYFIVKFPQRAGALKEFVNQALGPNDDITRFEYVKRNAKEAGPALVGVELKNKNDIHSLKKRMETLEINYRILNSDPNLFEYFI